MKRRNIYWMIAEQPQRKKLSERQITSDRNEGQHWGILNFDL